MMNTDQNSYQKIDDQPESPIHQSLEMNDEHPKLGEDANQLTSTERRERISSLIVIGILALLNGMSRTIILPTAWGYVNTFVPEKYAGIALGLVSSLYSLSSAIAGIIFGYIYDLGVSLKLLILFGILFQIVGNVLYFVGIDIYVVVTARFIAGVGMGIVPLLIADASRRSTPETRTQILTNIIACRQIGLIFGPSITVLLEPLNFSMSGLSVTVNNAPGLLMAILWFIMALVTICFFHDIPVTIPLPKSMSNLLGTYSSKEVFTRIYHICKQPVLIVLLIASFSLSMSQTAPATFLTPLTNYIFNWTSLQVSFLYLFTWIEVVIVYFILNFISKTFRDQTILLFGFVALTTSYLIGVIILPLLTVGILTSRVGFFLFISLVVLAAALITVTLISLFSKHTRDDQQGISLGFQNAVSSIAVIIAPLYAGGLLGIWWIAFLLLFILVGITTILIGIFYRSFELEKTDELSSLLPVVNKDNC